MALGALTGAVSLCASPAHRTIQCRNDGRSCWCVGADGSEVPGSRQPGRPVACTCGRGDGGSHGRGALLGPHASGRQRGA